GSLVGEMPPPRGWGTHVRFLAHYVRDLGLLTWEEGVRHMTSAPAQRLGFLDRGIVRPGNMADLVVFDPDTLRDTATYEQPRRYPVGVSHVVNNGQLVIDDAAPTRVWPSWRSTGRAWRQPPPNFARKATWCWTAPVMCLSRQPWRQPFNRSSANTGAWIYWSTTRAFCRQGRSPTLPRPIGNA